MTAKYRTGQSAIHGKGLFAEVRIPKETLIGVFEGPRTKRDGPHVLWVEDEHGKVYGVRGQNELRFLNHADAPNAELDGQELWSLRRIEKDEEITIHYGAEWTDAE
ncbi:MAG: SET domain-containing protein-lysine N-methyltransferase [Planctomycetota bacterium]|nr:SET domain-containing protein-lysine N-methyltransferase [Planctomycetota bacterium]